MLQLVFLALQSGQSIETAVNTNLELVQAVSNAPLRESVRNLLVVKDLETLQSRAEAADCQVRYFEDTKGAVVIVGDPFGVGRRARLVAAVEELAAMSAVDSSKSVDELSQSGREGLIAFVDENAGEMYGARVSASKGAKVGVGIGWAITLEGGGKSVATCIDDGSCLRARPNAFLLESIPRPAPGAGAPSQGSDRPPPSILFTVAPHVTAIAARATLANRYLAEVASEAGRLYDRFVDATDALERASGVDAPKAGALFGSLAPHQQSSLLEDRRANYNSYGFSSPDSAMLWLQGAKVARVDRQVHIRVKVQLPDGSIEGFSNAILP